MSIRDPWTSTQNLTGTLPTLSTDGIDLSGAEGYRVILSANAGQTLSGAGSLVTVYYDHVLQRWIQNPDLLNALSLAHAGVRDVVFPDQAVFVPYGRLFVMPSGITVSGGTTVDVGVRLF